MDAVNMAEARRNFSDLVARVAYQGVRVIVERRGKPMAAVISIEDLHRLEEWEDQSGARRQRQQEALARVRAVRAAILADRQGVPLPDAVEMIRELREERDDEIDSLR